VQVTYGLLGPLFHGRGWQDTDYPANPAAGANFSHTVDGRWAERLIAVTFTLTTSATAATRVVTVDYAKPGRAFYYQDGPATTQTASNTNTYNGSIGFGQSDFATGTPAWFNLFGQWLYPGITVAITVASIQAADQLSGIALTWERVQTGDAGYPIGAMDLEDMRYWYKEFADH
jgi:hypothetical protein